MTGEEGGKVVSRNLSSSSASHNVGGGVDLSLIDRNSPPVTNGQSDVDSNLVDSSDLNLHKIGGLGLTPTSLSNNVNNSGGVDGGGGGDFEGGQNSTVHVNSNSSPRHPQSPQKRNGRTESGTFSQKDEPLAEYPVLSEEELAGVPRDELVQVYRDLHQHCTLLRKENGQLKESEEKTRVQQLESSRRENVLVMRLTTKEQELQDYVAQLNELKSAVTPTPGSLRSTLLDPSVNFVVQRMKKELEETKKKLEDTQNDLNARKFTPDSNTGKRLMAKCRMLYQENEDLGKMITSGKVSKLEGDLAIQNSLTEEMKKSQSEFEDLIQELDDDIEGMQSTIYFLQQQLREAKAASTPSNSQTATNNNSDEIKITVPLSDLCAQCRATQQDKGQAPNVSSCPGQPPCLKMEVCDDSDGRKIMDDERTCVNGEADLSRPDTEESDRPVVRTSKSKHSSRDSKEEESDTLNMNSRHVVQSGEDEGEESRTKKLKVENMATGDITEGGCLNLSVNNSSSPPPAKRTKLANHSSSPPPTSNPSSKHLNPVQVHNSTESPILVNSNSSSGSNRNGSVDH